MTQQEMLVELEKMKVVPVVKLDRVADACPLCNALAEGGLPVAEITFRTDAAEESIRQASKAFPQMLIGAGSVVNTDQAARALDAGASFIVSPGLSRKVVEFVLDHNVAIFPGVCTPSEIMTAMEYGLPVVKFFPAKQYGGIATIKALSAPFPSMRFMPTGGVSAANLQEFLAVPSIIAVGGSWMVKNDLINAGDFESIRKLTSEAAELAGAV